MAGPKPKHNRILTLKFLNSISNLNKVLSRHTSYNQIKISDFIFTSYAIRKHSTKIASVYISHEKMSDFTSLEQRLVHKIEAVFMTKYVGFFTKSISVSFRQSLA